MAAERYTIASSTSAIIGAFESIRECLKEVKTRDLVDHMPVKEKNCFVELKERVEKLLSVVRNEKLKVVLLGKTGTGKSKVMNALLGGEILPSGYGHVTSNVCCIEGAAVEGIRVIVADSSGHEEESSLDLNNVLSSFTTNIPHSKWIRVLLPQDSCPLLREGVVLCDTPGIDGDKDSDEVLVSTCTDADVFVYVCDGTCTIENTEREYLLQVRDTFSNLTPYNLFIVFNHWDVVCMDENAGDVRGQHVERASKFLSEEFGFERNSMKESVFFISAKDSLDVHQGSMKIGDLPVQRRNCYLEFQSFEKRLKDCLTTYSRQTKYNRHCQSIRSCSEEATAILKRTQEVIEEKRRCATSERVEAARELAALQDAVSEFKEELDKTCHTTTEHIKEQFDEIVKEKESALREKVDDFLGDFARNREEGYKNDLVHHLQTEVLSANDILCKKMEQIHEDAQRPLREILAEMDVHVQQIEPLQGLPHFSTKGGKVDISTVIGVVGFLHFLFNFKGWGQLGGMKAFGAFTVVQAVLFLGGFFPLFCLLPAIFGSYKAIVWYTTNYRKEEVNRVVVEHLVDQIHQQRQSVRQGCSAKVVESLCLLVDELPDKEMEHLAQSEKESEAQIAALSSQLDYVCSAIKKLQVKVEKVSR